MDQQVKNRTSIHEVAGSIPDLAQWVKGSGLVTSCGVMSRVKVSGAAQIPHFCGCGVGWQLQLQFDP